MDEVKNGRKAFTKEEWMDILLRSTGMEPDKLSDRAKWLLIARMIPLVENNFNMCELGPRSTGKSYIYEQISPNSILVAGGQTTVANLFYNMSNNTVGLVGMWDVVAFDEVAGIKFKDKDGIQIMKGYMASGAFSRGKAEIQAKASMVFVGNINQSVETLQKTSSLFDPFPPEMGTDTAFLDRFHAYIPGWEIPKYRPDSFTNDYGFITDYLSEFMRELRKDNYSNIAEKYFKLGNNLNQRDAIAVRKLISGFIKLIYPDGEVSKDEVAEIMDISLELRRRVKEQLSSKPGGVLGTPGFMAPEIVRGEKRPSRETDRYSLSVLLFYLFMVNHPLEGKLEANIKCMDYAARVKLYGTDPVFIFDPDNRTTIKVVEKW